MEKQARRKLFRETTNINQCDPGVRPGGRARAGPEIKTYTQGNRTPGRLRSSRSASRLARHAQGRCRVWRADELVQAALVVHVAGDDPAPADDCDRARRRQPHLCVGARAGSRGTCARARGTVLSHARRLAGGARGRGASGTATPRAAGGLVRA